MNTVRNPTASAAEPKIAVAMPPIPKLTPKKTPEIKPTCVGAALSAQTSSPYEYNILHFHPGYLDQYLLDNTSLTLPRCRDLATLCDPQVRRWLDEHEVELTNFDALYE